MLLSMVNNSLTSCVTFSASIISFSSTLLFLSLNSSTNSLSIDLSTSPLFFIAASSSTTLTYFFSLASFYRDFFLYLVIWYSMKLSWMYGSKDLSDVLKIVLVSSFTNLIDFSSSAMSSSSFRILEPL